MSLEYYPSILSYLLLVDGDAGINGDAGEGSSNSSSKQLGDNAQYIGR